MRKTTKNKVAMYKAVKTVVTNNSAAWTGLPAFVNVFTQFGEKLNLLEQHANNQTLALIGVSAVKEAKRKEAAEKAYAVCSSLGAYAVLSNNVGLINQMKIGKWDLLKGGSLKTLQLMDLILVKATEHESNLGDFGVNQASIAELQTLRDELEVMLGAPRNAIIERKVLTSQIKALVRELDVMLKFQLDKLMNVLREEHPDFYTVYRNARIIIDLKATHGSGGNGARQEPGENTRGNERGGSSPFEDDPRGS